MQRAFSASIDVAPDQLFAVVSDLTTYPDWLDVVDSVEPAGDDAWFVTLRARIGPFARSKRLRMVRNPNTEPSAVRFERAETDGRDHSAWVLSAVVTTDPDAPDDPAKSAVTLDLDYGGSLWTGPLEAVLDNAAKRATTKLQAYVAERPRA